MDTLQWFYGRDGVRHGPVSEDDLRRLAGAGELRAYDLVWRDGMPNWQVAAEVPGLFPQASAPPPIPAGLPLAPIAYANPQHRPPPVPGAGDDAAMRMLLPVGRSGWAIAAGYCGLLSLMCWILGPAAILCGVMAIRDMRLHPERHGMGRVITGFVLGGLGTLILCAYGLTVMRRLLH
jgi:hypothetical protein